MNKRIKKKNDYIRKYDMLYKAVDLIDEYMTIYAHLVGRENHHYADDSFWDGYDKWNKSLSGRRTWSALLKKNNILKKIQQIVLKRSDNNGNCKSISRYPRIGQEYLRRRTS